MLDFLKHSTHTYTRTLGQDFRIRIPFLPMKEYGIRRSTPDAFRLHSGVDGNDNPCIYLSGIINSPYEELEIIYGTTTVCHIHLHGIKDIVQPIVEVNNVPLILKDGYHVNRPTVGVMERGPIELIFSLPEKWCIIDNNTPVPNNTITVDFLISASISLPIQIRTRFQSRIDLTVFIDKSEDSVASLREWIQGNPRPLSEPREIDDEDRCHRQLTSPKTQWPQDGNHLEEHPLNFAAAIHSDTDGAKRQRLIAAMKNLGLSEADLAEALGDRDGKSPEISRYCSGNRSIPPKKIPTLSKNLKIDERWLATGDPSVAPEWMRRYCDTVKSIQQAMSWAQQNGISYETCPPGPQKRCSPATPSQWVCQFLYRLDDYLTGLSQEEADEWLKQNGHMVAALPYLPIVMLPSKTVTRPARKRRKPGISEDVTIATKKTAAS